MTSFFAVKMASCFSVIIGHFHLLLWVFICPNTGFELDPMKDTGVK